MLDLKKPQTYYFFAIASIVLFFGLTLPKFLGYQDSWVYRPFINVPAAKQEIQVSSSMNEAMNISPVHHLTVEELLESPAIKDASDQIRAQVQKLRRILSHSQANTDQQEFIHDLVEMMVRQELGTNQQQAS
eukprot:TRINITY_DN13399_c0_g1_i1.p5 TRINITY_DN13399_c0_g1~~TRINITY_DN13399_c0_g1_i1.p5  ORF type:complete len:132 (-),score=15.56 TRINITY_DN13399_c0_g1_i1:963-1358(-)